MMIAIQLKDVAEYGRQHGIDSLRIKDGDNFLEVYDWYSNFTKVETRHKIIDTKPETFVFIEK